MTVSQSCIPGRENPGVALSQSTDRLVAGCARPGEWTLSRTRMRPRSFPGVLRPVIGLLRGWLRQAGPWTLSRSSMRHRSYPGVMVPVRGTPRGDLGQADPADTVAQPYSTPVLPRALGPSQRTAIWPAGPSPAIAYHQGEACDRGRSPGSWSLSAVRLAAGWARPGRRTP